MSEATPTLEAQVEEIVQEIRAGIADFGKGQKTRPLAVRLEKLREAARQLDETLGEALICPITGEFTEKLFVINGLEMSQELAGRYINGEVDLERVSEGDARRVQIVEHGRPKVKPAPEEKKAIPRKKAQKVKAEPTNGQQEKVAKSEKEVAAEDVRTAEVTVEKTADADVSMGSVSHEDEELPSEEAKSVAQQVIEDVEKGAGDGEEDREEGLRVLHQSLGRRVGDAIFWREEAAAPVCEHYLDQRAQWLEEFAGLSTKERIEREEQGCTGPDEFCMRQIKTGLLTADLGAVLTDEERQQVAANAEDNHLLNLVRIIDQILQSG